MMNTDTLIIIIIFSILGAIFTLLILIRILKSLSSTSNPLPPPQPLAHHREQEIAKFHSSQYYHLNKLSSPSKVSLLEAPSPFHSRFGTTTSSTRLSESVPETSPLVSSTVDELGFEVPPNPRQHFARPSSVSSIASISTGRITPPSNIPTVRTEEAQGPIPFPRPRSRPRPLSSSSAYTTTTGTGNHSLVPSIPSTSAAGGSTSRPRYDSGRRGLPHGPHSQMQIVLPAPLAPLEPSISVTPGIDLSSDLGHHQRDTFNMSRPHSFYSISQMRSPSPLKRPMSRMSISHLPASSEGDTGSNYSSLNRRSMVDRWLPATDDIHPPLPSTPFSPPPNSSSPLLQSPTSPSATMIPSLIPPPSPYPPPSPTPSSRAFLSAPTISRLSSPSLSQSPSSSSLSPITNTAASSPGSSRSPSRSGEAGPMGPRQKKKSNVLRKSSRPSKMRLADGDPADEAETEKVVNEPPKEDEQQLDLVPQAI